MVDIKVFDPGSDASEIYRFRYAIYEDEMSRHDQYADHDKRQIVDPLDAHGYNIAAYVNGNIVAVNRVNFCADGDPGNYLDFYELDNVPEDYPDKVAYSTRIMAAESARGRLPPLLVSVAGFRLGVERGVNWCYCDCNAHLVPFFTKLGFESFRPNKTHPSFGEVTVMRFDLRDGKQFDRKRSVIGRYLSRGDAAGA